MEVQRVLHMNGGDGDESYAKNSSGQKVIMVKAVQALKESVEKLCLSTRSTKLIRIADLGCSSGPNTFLAADNMIQFIDEMYSTKLGIEPPLLQIFLNDLEGNDFNNVFKSLPKFYSELERKGRKQGSCFVAAMPGSFYGRLFPEDSIHFMYSSYSLHWLSQVPTGLEAESGKRLNKGSICCTKTSPRKAHEAYLSQFTKDFATFLKLRSVEMVTHGHLFLTLQGEMDGFDHFVPIGMALNEMANEGLIEEEKLDQFNLPLYGPSLEELKSTIENEGSFEVLNLQAYELYWDDLYASVHNKKPENKRSKGKYVALNLKAVFEPILASHFGKTIMDDLFERLAKKISEEMEPWNGYVNNLAVSLAKKDG